MIEVAHSEFDREAGSVRCQQCRSWQPATVKEELEDGSVLLHPVQCKPDHFAWFDTGEFEKYPANHPTHAGELVIDPWGHTKPIMEKRAVPGCPWGGEIKVLPYVYVDPGEVLELSVSETTGQVVDKMV